MTGISADMAHDWPCPIARLKPYEKVLPDCEGPLCVLWRWLPLDAAILVPHVRARRKEVGPDVPHKDVVAWVMENREALGLPTKPTHGFCGLGGQVLA